MPPRKLTPFSFTPADSFATEMELFQQVVKQQPSYWVCVMPQDYDTPAGVFPFPDPVQARDFATARMDEGSTCFQFQGVYVPGTVPLMPHWTGNDPKEAPLLELRTGRMPEYDELIEHRNRYRRQQEAALALLEVEDDEETTAESETSEPGETIVEVVAEPVAEGEPVAEAVPPAEPVPTGLVLPQELPDDQVAEAESDDFDDFSDLPPPD